MCEDTERSIETPGDDLDELIEACDIEEDEDEDE